VSTLPLLPPCAREPRRRRAVMQPCMSHALRLTCRRDRRSGRNGRPRGVPKQFLRAHGHRCACCGTALPWSPPALERQSHTAAPWPGPLAELGAGPPGSSAYLIPRAQPPLNAGFVPNNLPVRPGRPSIRGRSPAPRGAPCRRPTPATHVLRAVRAAGLVSRPAVGRAGSVQQAAEPS